MPITNEPAETGEPLFRKAAKGGFWVFFLQIVQRGLDMARLIVLARLLAPEDFGLFGIALLALAVIETFTQTGFQAALIQKKGDIDAYLNTAWTVRFIRATILAALLYLGAPYAAQFFEPPAELTVDHLEEPNKLAEQLQLPHNPAIGYIRKNLSDKTIQMLDEYDSSARPSEELQWSLVDDLNRLMKRDDLYSQESFADITHQDQNQKLMHLYRSEQDTARLNRLLLEVSFPQEIKRVVLDRFKATRIIQVIALSFILTAFSNIGIIYFTKELEFNKYFIFQISGTVANVLVAISLAFIYKSVWALVAGRLAGQFTRCVLSYILHPYRPRFGLDISKAKELFRFGKWVFSSSILIFLATQGDDIFVGKMLGLAALAYYQMAYKLSNMTATETSHIISRVTLPVYAKIQDDIPRLREAYFKVLKLTAFLSFPIAGMIFILAGDFTRIFLKERWLPMIPVIQALACFGLIRAINATIGPIYYALKKPSKTTKFSLLYVVVMAVIIYPLALKGELMGVCVAVNIANVICLLANINELPKLIDCRKRDIVKSFGPHILVTSIMLLLIYLFRYIMIGEVSQVVVFTGSTLIGAVVYLSYAKVMGFSLTNMLKTGNLFQELRIKPK